MVLMIAIVSYYFKIIKMDKGMGWGGFCSFFQFMRNFLGIIYFTPLVSNLFHGLTFQYHYQLKIF